MNIENRKYGAWLRRRLRTLCNGGLLVWGLLSLASCGELFDLLPTVSPYHMELDRHELTIVEGDRFRITPLFTPDTISNMVIYWMSDNPDIATIEDNEVVGVSIGETTVTGISIEYQIYDTCRVTVVPFWSLDHTFYPYDMVVYARVTVDGEPLQAHQSVGAFCGRNLRGVGELCAEGDLSYMLIRVYSPFNPYEGNTPFDPLDPSAEEQEEVINFRLYDHKTSKWYEFPQSIVFDGEMHGTLSNLFELNLDTATSEYNNEPTTDDDNDDNNPTNEDS